MKDVKDRRFWLLKTEPSAFSIDDLRREKTTPWTGVRNYRARNFMRDDMRTGDLCFLYHSNAGDETGIAGIAKVASSPYPDPTQFEKSSHYFDETSTKENPRWQLVDVAFVKRFAEVIPLAALKADPQLEGMMLLQKGSRLSVQPVSEKHFHYIVNELAA